MFDSMLDTIFTSSQITASAFFMTTALALLLGIGTALLCMYKNKYSQSFAVTLAMLPAMVAVVIMLVNGNIGAGVAVAGAFSLVRFRSAPGTAREIGAIFAAMGMGLIMGMGYIGYAALFTVLIGLAMLIYAKLASGDKKDLHKVLKITIPENLNYSDVFDDIFKEYTKNYKLNQVKTSNMGFLFKLNYEIYLKDVSREKEFIDKLRTRNGNLEISIANYQTPVTDQL